MKIQLDSELVTKLAHWLLFQLNVILILLIIILICLLVVRVGSNALILTGMSFKVTKVQVNSFFSVSLIVAAL